MASALRRPHRGRPVGARAAGPAAGSARPPVARGAHLAGSGLLGLARLVRLATTIVVVVVVAAIVLRLAGANPGNVIVRDVHDAGRWLVGPFANVFTPHNAKEAMALSWGLAALVYLLAGTALAGVLARGRA